MMAGGKVLRCNRCDTVWREELSKACPGCGHDDSRVHEDRFAPPVTKPARGGVRKGRR